MSLKLSQTDTSFFMQYTQYYVMVKTFALDEGRELTEGQFVCLRRANDVSQNDPSHHRLPLQNIQIKSLELITQETFMSYLPKMEKI